MIKLSDEKDSLVLESSLQVYFYDQLQEFNKKSTAPIQNEFVYYSSLVMDHFGDASKYFETVEGKTRDKILGIKLLESANEPKEKQKIILKDIAETALVLCGYFSESLNKKIIDVKYYSDVGTMAYSRLNAFSPQAFHVEGFYSKVAKKFETITMLMNLVSSKHETDPYSGILLVTSPVKSNSPQFRNGRKKVG